MRLAEVTREVSNQLNEVSDTARRGARSAYQVALENPRASAAVGVVVAAAIVGGVLWSIFGGRRRQEQHRTRRVRAGTGRKRAKTTRASGAAAA